MRSLPVGTVTFLFTDIEGSTHLLKQLGDRYSAVLADYRKLLNAALTESGGQEVDTQGDSSFVAFPRARDALIAAAAAQKAFDRYNWPTETAVRVRMGIHTGEPSITEAGYVGMDVHRAARICAAGHGGQILISQTTYELIQDDLPEGMFLRDLGEHRLKDLVRPERLFQLVSVDLPADFPSLKSLGMFPNNLPTQLTSFVGREKEIAEVRRLLATANLVTLTGAGGSGKTRLALQFAAEISEDYPDGTWWVDLSALSDPALVPLVVASTLHIREQPGRSPTETLAEFLKHRKVLLLLDNCEHLGASCAELAYDLLRRCLSLKIIATSRERLHIAGETLYSVPSLSVPDPARLSALEDLDQYESVQLFSERALAVLPAFKITDRIVTPLAHICQRLDGMPLAIELAAARVKVLSLEQIAERLDNRFGLLKSGNPTAVRRHQTLQAAIDWSYNLLSLQEKVLLRRLSVFAGGWNLEAVETVCTDDGLEKSEVIDLLTRLIDKSLVIAEEQNAMVRYRLLETIRQYAWDRLSELDEATAMKTRHYDWCVGLAEKAERYLTGPDQISWLDLLEREHNNFRAALEWSSNDRNTEKGLRLAISLGDFWNRRGHWREGRDWLDRFLPKSDNIASLSRVRGLDFKGRFEFNLDGAPRAEPLFEQNLVMARMLDDKRAIALSLRALGSFLTEKGDYAKGGVLLEEGLEFFRELGDKPLTAAMLANLGASLYYRGQLARATEVLEECLSLSREIVHVALIASSLHVLGRVAKSWGDYERAITLIEEAIGLFRQLGDRARVAIANLHLADSIWYQSADSRRSIDLAEESLATFQELEESEGIATAKLHVGFHEWRLGDSTRARTLLEESLVLYKKLRIKWGAGVVLRYLGLVARDQGHFEQAESHLKESLEIVAQLGDKRTIAETLRASAGVACSQFKLLRAAKLFGAADVIARTLEVPDIPVDHIRYEGDLETVRQGLDTQIFESKWAEGQAMTLEQAIEYALGKGD